MFCRRLPYQFPLAQWRPVPVPWLPGWSHPGCRLKIRDANRIACTVGGKNDRIRIFHKAPHYFKLFRLMIAFARTSLISLWRGMVSLFCRWCKCHDCPPFRLRYQPFRRSKAIKSFCLHGTPPHLYYTHHLCISKCCKLEIQVRYPFVYVRVFAAETTGVLPFLT